MEILIPDEEARNKLLDEAWVIYNKKEHV